MQQNDARAKLFVSYEEQTQFKWNEGCFTNANNICFSTKPKEAPWLETIDVDLEQQKSDEQDTAIASVSFQDEDLLEADEHKPFSNKYFEFNKLFFEEEWKHCFRMFKDA